MSERLRLHLKRPHVAPLRVCCARWTWEATLVLGHLAVLCRNLVDGSAAFTEAAVAGLVRHGEPAVSGKLSEVQVVGADVNLVGPVWVEARRCCRGIRCCSRSR